MATVYVSCPPLTHCCHHWVTSCPHGKPGIGEGRGGTDSPTFQSPPKSACLFFSQFSPQEVVSCILSRVCCYYLQEDWIARHLLDVELQLLGFESQFCHLLALCLLHVIVSLYVRWCDVGFDIKLKYKEIK